MSLFARNLRFLRKKGNRNQDEIAILFNKQANTIGNWENSKSEPNLLELIKLGDFFKVSMEDLIQVDLEQRSPVSMPYSGDDLSVRGVKPGREPEFPGGGVNELGSDAFWLILRELRAVHQKVDLLITDRESSEIKKNSDKSNH